jgi:UDP-N-acetyl-2-amino-2-deoxyglucuronate dehydrogenase
LRLHPSIIELKEKVSREISENPDKVYDVDLTYLTSRGQWYFISWKGDEDKAGGIATNIGVHFYDMLGYIFGNVKKNETHIKNDDVNSGYLEFEHARVRWFLSVNYDYIPDDVKASGQRTYRSITVDGKEVEFSGGFTELHTTSYEHILKGDGFGLEEARASIEIVSQIRKQSIATSPTELHPFTEKFSKNV